MPPDDVTLGELVRAVSRIEQGQQRQDRRFDDLEAKLDRTYARKDVADERDEKVDFRLLALESWRVWITRATVTNFLYPLIGALVAGVVLAVVLKGGTP